MCFMVCRTLSDTKKIVYDKFFVLNHNLITLHVKIV